MSRGFRLITDLSTDNVRGLVLSLALPSMLSQLVSVLYSIVDRMFIGHIAGIGDLALAGVGVCGPIVTLISSFAFLVGIGGAPLVSIRLGEGREAEARQVLANAFVMLLGLSLVVMGLALLLRRPILYTFGASESSYVYAERYFTVYVLGTVFALLSVGLNQFIITQGLGREGMSSVMLGAVMNIVLDPIFIFGLHMGVRGAALATVLSQLASCIYVLRVLCSGRVRVGISFGGYQLKLMLRICAIGLSAFLIIMLDNMMLISVNAMLQRYGGAERGDLLLACNTILQSFMLLVTMPLGGLTMGTQTVLGYNLGARRPDKILRAQKLIFMLGISFCSCMFLFAQLLPGFFVRIFTANPEYIALSKRLIRIYTWGVIPLAVQYEIVDGFTGMGMVKAALPLSMFRKTVYFACVFLLPLFFDIEVMFWCEPISDIIPPLLSAYVYLKNIRRWIHRPVLQPV